MKAFAVAAAACCSIAFAQIAAAAPPVGATSNWTGFYIGANLGGGWSRNNASLAPNDPGSAFFLRGEMPSVSFVSSGVLGGMQLGYNWQFDPKWILGFESDFQGSDIKGSATSSNPALIGAPIAPLDEKTNWFGTVRARFGYLTTKNLLVFATGGFAYGQIEDKANFYYTTPGLAQGVVVNGIGAACSTIVVGFLSTIPGASCFVGSEHNTSFGWALGAGLEYAFLQRWTVKAEYLYVSLQAQAFMAQAAFPNGGLPASLDAGFNRDGINIARLGVNYRF